MEDDITCGNCLETYKEPVLLQCNHPMCLQCAQSQFSYELLRKPFVNFPLITKHRIEKIKEHDEKHNVEICCPHCNTKTTLLATQGINVLPKDTQLTGKIEESKKQRTMCSEECGASATSHCSDCGVNFCNSCFEQSHTTPKRKNHKTTAIDDNQSVRPVKKCPHHGFPLDLFCQKDQVACCYRCFQIGDHLDHEHTFINKVVEKMRREVDVELEKVNKQINQLKQTSDNMDKLKEEVNQLHKEFETKVTENFNQSIQRLERTRDTLIDKSKALIEITLSNISLQQAALTDLLNRKSGMVEDVNKWIKKDDLGVIKCKELLQRNQDTEDSMISCCESGKLKTHIDMSPVEQLIDKLASISKIPSDIKLLCVTGLKESTRDENGVTVQWDPVQYGIETMYFVVQITADNNDATVKNTKLPSNVTSFQVPIEKSWKQLVCTVHCAIDDQLVGPKCSPLSINLIGNDPKRSPLTTDQVENGPKRSPLISDQVANDSKCSPLTSNLIGNDPQSILLHVKEKCSQQVYDRVQSTFDQKGTELNLSECNMGDSGAIVFAKMLPHLEQLERIDIDSNQIGDAGVTAIADGMKQLTQLQQFSISDNQIGDSGAAAIANAIKQLTELQQLFIYNNKIGDTGATMIADAIGQLTQMNYLWLENNNISASVQDQLKKSAKFSSFYI